MIPTEMLGVANHLWQSTLWAGVVWVLSLVLRKNRAAVRYWLWLAASVKFLIPFSLFVSIGSHLGWRAVAGTEQFQWSMVVDNISLPFALSAPVLHETTTTAVDLIPALLFSIWACGFAASVFFWLRCWSRTRAVRQGATPLPLNLPISAMSCRLCVEPGVFGIRDPVLLLPDGIIDRLTPAQLAAIVTHELCHLRRRDNLTGAIHMIIEAIFWFHPLVWWIRTRLIEERELACDEAVLDAGCHPHDYAEGILSICRFYLESPSCVMGVTGANLKKRIERILAPHVAADLDISKKVLLACACLGSIVLPFLIGMLNAPPIEAQTSQTLPEFEVASIKPRSDPGMLVRIQPFPGGRLVVENFSLRMLMMFAYGVEGFQITGGPDWINSERYDIQAKAEGNPSGKQMAGPMLRALLEDRFKVKLHREMKELPVYELTIARGGVKLHRSEEGGCTLFSLDSPPPPLPAPSEKRPTFCGFLGFGVDGMNRTLDVLGVSMSELARSLSRGDLHRTVLDRTGLTGTFDIHLKWSVDTGVGFPRSGEPNDQGFRMPSPDTSGSSIFTAIQQQLGLALKASKGPVEVLVIDHADKPSTN